MKDEKKRLRGRGFSSSLSLNLPSIRIPTEELGLYGDSEADKLRPLLRLTSAGLNTVSLLSLFLCLCACGGGYYYEEAVRLERQGMLMKAADYYQLFTAKNLEDPRAPGALFKAAEIYARKFSLCSKAKPVLETLLKNYPADPSRPAAMKDLLVCPDYLPVDRPMLWTYGDSETGGVNARQVTRVADWDSSKVNTVTKTYAGKKIIATQKRKYRLEARDLVETQGGLEAIVLRYPIEKGLSWSATVNGQRARYTVEAVGLKVKVRAGEFENCVKVKQAFEGAPSWIYEYYAPWTGKIMTSVAGKGFENRVTELIKYEETQK